MGGQGATDTHFFCDVRVDSFLLLEAKGLTTRRKSTFNEGAPYARDKPFPHVVPALDYSLPEGLAIGKGHDVVEIEVSPPLTGFLDGLVMHGRTLYIMNPAWEMVQVVELDKEMITGEFVGTITDPNMSGVASGALFGKSLYVNNAHYDACCDDDGNLFYAERSITKLNRHAVEPLE